MDENWLNSSKVVKSSNNCQISLTLLEVVFEVLAQGGGRGGHKVLRSIYGSLRTMYMVQGPIQQHVTLNIGISSHMKEKISSICHFLALGDSFSKTRKIQILTIFI